MRRKITGSATASIVIFVAFGMVASVLGLRQYSRLTTEHGWVASSAMQAGQVITRNSLKQKRIDSESVGLNDPRHLIGKRLKVNKQAEEVFVPTDFDHRKPVKKTLSQQVPPGRVLYTLKVGNSHSMPLSELRRGDRLDVLVRGRSGVRTVAIDAHLVGIIGKPGVSPANNDKSVMSLLPAKNTGKGSAGGATSLVLSVLPEHVYPLASAGSGENISLVLHGSDASKHGEVVSVTPVRNQREVEVLSGFTRSKVYVNR